MKHPTTIPEACRHVAERINKICQNIGQNKHKAVVHIEGEDGWTCDSQVDLVVVADNGKTYETGYCINPYLEEKAQFCGKDQREFIRYYVMHEEVTRGVAYYPDGSGEPDTSDLVDDFSTDSPDEAAKKIILLNIELQMNQMLEAEYEERLCEQMAKDEEEMEAWYKEQSKIRD